MLVLTRREGETIYIGDDIVVKILGIRNNQLKLGITAPKSIPILRDNAKQKIRDLAGQVYTRDETGFFHRNEL